MDEKIPYLSGQVVIILIVAVLLFALVIAAKRYLSGAGTFGDMSSRYTLVAAACIALLGGALRLIEGALKIRLLPDFEAERISFTLLLLLFGYLTLILVKFPEKFEDVKARMKALEEANAKGLLPIWLDGPRVWQTIREDACSSDQSINVAITMSDFSAPREWDDELSKCLAQRLKEDKPEVHYTVAVYRDPNQRGPEEVNQLVAINDIYNSKKLTYVRHGFIDQSNYFRFNIIIIDRKRVAFVWNSQPGRTATKGIYFKDSPELGSELNEWFTQTCLMKLTDAKDVVRGGMRGREELHQK